MLSSTMRPAGFRSTIQAPIPCRDLLSYVFENVEEYDQNTPIYIDCDNEKTDSLSICETRAMIRKLIAGLQEQGLKKGDCVCIQSPNTMYYSILCLAVVGAGGIFTGTNPSLTTSELVHHYKQSKARFVIAVEEIMPATLKAATQCGILSSDIFIFAKRHLKSSSPTSRYWTDLLQHGERDWASFKGEEISQGTIAALYPTSGTSGAPKLAEISHYNVVASSVLLHDSNVKPYKGRQIVVFPMFHLAATVTAHIAPIRQGWPTYILPRFNPEDFISVVSRYQITDTGMVPAMMNAILQSGLATSQNLTSLRDGDVGAAPVSPEILRKWQALMHPDCRFTGAYGLTEATGIAMQIRWPEADSKQSMGRPLPNMEAKILGTDGKEIFEYDAPGELYLRGPTVFQGYHGNIRETDLSFDEEGFLKTGDIAYCDKEDKTWFIVDRKKELIKVRGFQVAPAEIEGHLLAHPAITDAAVIGVQVGGGEESPRAYVVTKDSVSEQEIKEYIALRLSSYKRLEGGVVKVDSLPRNANGKLVKQVLRDAFRKEQVRPKL